MIAMTKTGRVRGFVGTLALVTLVTGACSTATAATEDREELQRRLDEVTAERDALAAEDAKAAARYEAAEANQEALLALIEDPTAFGSEEEVLDLLDSMATPDIVSGDLAFGGTSTGLWRIGWRNTLFNNTDATVHTWRAWLSEDGSVGGSLWSWIGTAQNGEPFTLEGLELSRFSDDGLYSEVVMLYPYEDDEVRRRFREGG